MLRRCPMKLATPTAKVALRHILLATDFSAPAAAAFTYAKAIARRYDSDLFLLHVLPPAAYALTPPEAIGQTFEETYKAAVGEMEVLVHGLGDVRSQAIIHEGHVWDSVQALVEQKDIDLIVVGSHGRSGVGKLVLGSAAEEIFRRAACPVLIVGPMARPAKQKEIELRNILFSTDFEAESEAPIAYALSLAQEFQSHLTLLHVIAEKEHEHLPDHKRVVSYLFHRLYEKVPPNAGLWCEPEVVVQCGDPADRILGVADERPADLIVMGLHPTA